jgi:S1-C subfamily serine protease
MSVEPDSPAQRAGLQNGDVLVALGTHAIESVDDLHRILTEQHIGVPVHLSVLRRFDRIDITAVPEESAPHRK